MWGSVVATLLLLATAAFALPSGDVVRLNRDGYFKLTSLNGYSAINGNNPFTMTAWIYTTANDFTVFNVGPTNLAQCTGESGFGVASNQRLAIFACNRDPASGGRDLNAAWHHIALVHEGGSKGYVDGALDWTSTPTLLTTTDVGFIGARAYQPVRAIANGIFWLDDLRIWSRALSQAELQFDMHGGAVPTGLLGNYNGNHTLAGGLIDAVYGNNGNATGTAPNYTTTARCPAASYIASCGALSCRYLLADPSVPLCGPCSRGYSAAVNASTLTGYCGLDVPDLPTSVSAAPISPSCVNVYARWPLISAAVTSFTATRLDTGAQVTQLAGSADFTSTLTICGLPANVSVTVSVTATNAAGTGPSVQVVVTAPGSNCPAGSYSSSDSSCTACPAGTFSLAGATQCTLCPTGSFAPSSNSSACTQCAPGTYQCSKAGTSCDACAVGKYASDAGQSECTLCQTGRFAADTSSTVCFSCAAGSYAASIGKSVCTSCGAGTFSTANATVCSSCAAGSFADTTGSSACISCYDGTFSASLQSTACTACAINSYAPVAAATTCAACSFGTWTNSTGSTSCIGCSLGTYATISSGGATTCESCPSTCTLA